jgi:hypothetical protein
LHRQYCEWWQHTAPEFICLHGVCLCGVLVDAEEFCDHAPY